MLKKYREFLFRGNLLDLAIAFILGVTFTAVITAFTDGILMNLIAALVGQPDFDAVVFTVDETPILVGTFLTALVNFLLVATVLFFIVQAALRAQRPAPEGAAAPETDEVLLLREIRDLLAQPSFRG